ncbi:MAG: hypothetical protein JXP37_05700 [Coriobacteriia bacterium]|nr:hypothetical protein [Coriobacteriia bacterium]
MKHKHTALIAGGIMLAFGLINAAAGNALVAHVYLAAILAAIAVISMKGESGW